MKPIINLDELEMISHTNAGFEGKYGLISGRIGAKKLGYNFTVCPPGKSVCPFHNHRGEEEMFLILEGEGILRFGDAEYPLRKNDVVACPVGGREVAHQMINTGTTDLKYLAISTLERVEVCEYPDSDKVGIYVGTQEKRELRLLFKASDAVDYYVGESFPRD